MRTNTHALAPLLALLILLPVLPGTAQNLTVDGNLTVTGTTQMQQPLTTSLHTIFTGTLGVYNGPYPGYELGPNPTLLWVPGRAALRMGLPDSSWYPWMFGEYSVAFGLGSGAQANNSVAMAGGFTGSGADGSVAITGGYAFGTRSVALSGGYTMGANSLGIMGGFFAVFGGMGLVESRDDAGEAISRTVGIGNELGSQGMRV